MSGSQHDVKEIAGRKAAEWVATGMTLGLGTGSTVHFFLVALAERIQAEGLLVRGVPTSIQTETKAREFGIPLATLDDVTRIDLTVDGADEIDAHFDMIKGGGGALLREKVIAANSTRVVIVVGANKVVPKLGLTFALPVEVVPFASKSVERALAKLGCTTTRRMKEGRVFVTDNHNEILDCSFGRSIDDPATLERTIDAIPGVVESGLFVGLAHVRIVGNADGSCDVAAKS
ncbi:MAG: ribose-5-phosphate isomerase RpiA [Planctomycetota bacterium]|nr:ribose-5-phosphate isomerase RpiA [Planctomycetota bacterium]